MKKLIYCFLIGSLLCCFQGCALEETNIDPTKLDQVSLRDLLPTTLSQTARNQLGPATRVPSAIMQYTQAFDVFGYDEYLISPREFNLLWSSGWYAGAMRDCQIMIEQADAENQPHYAGIAKTLLAEALGNATLMFGDLPYSEAFKGIENLTPEYDTQEDIFVAIHMLLDEAIVAFQSPAVPGGPAEDDLIFGGNIAKWLATAKALKARYLLQMTRANSQAAAQALDVIRDGAISSLADQPNFQWGNNENEMCPLAGYMIQRPNTIQAQGQFITQLTGDPRLDKYFYWNGNEYFLFDNNNRDRLYWYRPDAATPIISYVEVAFMEAEALLATGASIAAVEAALAQAITASMEQVELMPDDYMAYVTAQSDLSGLDKNQQLERIISEAYLAYFGPGHMISWANYRRTGFPQLTPDPDGAHALNPSGGIPKRFRYPESEFEFNRENVDFAVHRQFGALLDVPLWVYE